MSLLSQSRIMSNGDFINRVNTACVTAAIQITQENGFDRKNLDSPRHRLADEVDRGYQTGLNYFVRECALNATISAAEEQEPNSSKDEDILYVISSSWDKIAEIA